MTASSTDSITKKILLKAPRARVWRALTDQKEFGEWFGVILANSFKLGARVTGKVTYPGFEHVPFELTVEQLEPERRMAWRGHPDPVEPGRDYSKEATTLVVFELQDAEGGTLLTVTESGFDQLPPDRREKAFRGNEEGWRIQMENIERHVSQAR